MTRESLKQQLDGIVPKNPKSDWSTYQRNIINRAIRVLDTDRDVLDKIRTEIEFEVDHRTNMLCAEDVLAILDKYKAESEE